MKTGQAERNENCDWCTRRFDIGDPVLMQTDDSVYCSKSCCNNATKKRNEALGKKK